MSILKKVDQATEVVKKLRFMDTSLIPFLQMMYGLLFEESFPTDTIGIYLYMPSKMNSQEEIYQLTIQEWEQREKTYSSMTMN